MPWPPRSRWRDSVDRKLDQILTRLDAIMTSQQDIDAAVSAETALVQDIATQVTAIGAAQQAFAAQISALTAEIATLKGQGVDTSKLDAITSQLTATQGSLDTAVTALTAASQPPAPANPPA